MTLTSEEFKKKVVETEYDVLLAGFPCQPFSRIGSNADSEIQREGPYFLI